MPSVSGAREQRFAVEDAITAEAGNCNPVALTAYLRNFFAVTEGYGLHVSRN
jgi:hypothetical protein